jgi:transposase
MLGLPPSVRIYFATELVDMRNGIDGLRAIVEAALKKDAYQGHLFVFVGKAKDKVKILFWDRNGFVLYLKRLERGRFQLPAVDARTKHVASRERERSCSRRAKGSTSTRARSTVGQCASAGGDL